MFRLWKCLLLIKWFFIIITDEIKLPADSDEDCKEEDTQDLIEQFTSVKNSPSETIYQNLVNFISLKTNIVLLLASIFT